MPTNTYITYEIENVIAKCICFNFLFKNMKSVLEVSHKPLPVFQFYYYFAIVEDFILRFVWSLTVSVGEGLLIHNEILKTLLASLEIFRYVGS